MPPQCCVDLAQCRLGLLDSLLDNLARHRSVPGIIEAALQCPHGTSKVSGRLDQLLAVVPYFVACSDREPRGFFSGTGEIAQSDMVGDCVLNGLDIARLRRQKRQAESTYRLSASKRPIRHARESPYHYAASGVASRIHHRTGLLCPLRHCKQQR